MAFTRPKAAQIDFDATNISDSLIRINSSETDANTNDLGIVFERGSHTNAALIFDESTDTFRFISTTHSGAGSTNDINISAHHALHVGGLTINTAYTFPTSDGSANQFLQTDGSGALSFATVTSSFTLAADSGSNDSFSTGQTLTIAGGTGIDTTVSDNNISIAIDSTVATLTGSQTLTNKTLTNPTINAFSGTGNGSITGTLSIVTTTTDDSLLITTTEDSSSAAPVITLKRNSSSVADADYLGQIKFKGENDADQEVIYAKITGKIGDASDGTEDGIIEIAHVKAGSNNINVRMTSTEFKIMNGTDFDVETHDGSSAGLRLGNTLVTATAAELNIIDGDTSATSTTLADADRVVVNDAGTMKQVALTDFETYFEAALDTLSNVTSVGTLNGITIASTQTIDMGSNRVTQVADPVGNQDAATKAYVDANAGGEGGSSGFTQSTFTTAPGADGDFDLSFNVAQTTQETPFEAGGTDAFGVALGEVYDMMEPVGSVSTVDLGAFT